MNECLLDASALLAVLNQEPGNEKVAERLPHACISSVNLVEVISKLMDYGVEPSAAREAILETGLRVVEFGSEMAFVAGELRRETRCFGLSLGDRAWLATGLVGRVPVLTADRAWGQLDLGLDIQVLRPH